MSKRKQKIVLEGFTFSIGKLIIEQEAEGFDSDAFSENIRNAIGQVISAPTRLLSAESDDLPAAHTVPAIDAASKQKKRRRRSSSPALDSDAGSNGERSSRTKPNGARSLIDEMKVDGFFVQDRPISEIREELHTLGHNFKSNELSPVLLSMTKQKALSRSKNEKGTWVYRAG